jgi:hypothetical protein
MNAGVRLVHSYLVLNGYFTVTELPVLRELKGGGYDQMTDLDILGVRFPGAEYVVPSGRPGAADDLRLSGDRHLLRECGEVVDVIIAEVKEGKPRINDALMRHEALETALRRVGCVPEGVMGRCVEELRRRGESRVAGWGGPSGPEGAAVRVRIVAFGDGRQGGRDGYEVVSLQHVARFIDGHLERHHAVLHPADLGDTPLGLLHLLRKLR